MKNLVTLIFVFIGIQLNAQEPFEKNESYTYSELQVVYSELAKNHPATSKLIQFGESDYGENIQLFMISKSGSFKQESFKDKTILLINNAIHPGEPCGVDACVKLSKDLLADKENLPEDVIIAIIPMYNVGGAHNRNCCSRANQNGPLEYGFRGNAQNLDLNRDFIKSDSKNTRVFYKIFQFLKPNVFVDTHTSNGADYQHIMTLITSQTDKMHPWLATYTLDKLNPYLFNEMNQKGYPMVPYVHQMGKTPEDGIQDYLESPRYSTGYTNLFNTIGFVTETHMLKTYKQRVESTYSFLEILIDYMKKHKVELIDLKRKVNYSTGHSSSLPLNWELDTSRFEMIDFSGYEAEYKTSNVTNLDRLFYNRDKPWTKKIRYYNHYIPSDSVDVPTYYVIPQAWKKIIIRLQMNNVKMYRLIENQKVEVEVYYIDDYKTSKRPYEGHYLHSNIQTTKEIREIQYAKGDYVIPTRNFNIRFIVETLEPTAADSYFAWNYFDAILQQKEGFSAYVFEETALEVLNANPELKREFQAKRKNDSKFAEDGFAQLYFIYKNSDNYERTFNMYPVSRYMNEFNADEIEIAPKLIGV